MKRKYISPKIEEVRLDNQISLQLASTPPVNPRENSPAALAPAQTEGDNYTFENW